MKKTVFKAFLIPNEYLKGIKGGIGIEGESAVKCPSCTTNAPIIATKNLPPVYICTGCGCAWRIILEKGTYYLEIIKNGRP